MALHLVINPLHKYHSMLGINQAGLALSCLVWPDLTVFDI